jgi:hypothetical protein
MSNCLIFAFFQWLKHGGYVIARKSKYGWWPHFMWVQSLNDLEVLEYSLDKKVNRALPPIVFDGTVRMKKDEQSANH